MPRILIIDDEPVNHQLVARALEPLKAELHFASDGKEGVAKARALSPDGIITDVMMPDISGYEVTRILRREPQFSSTPILVLTAQSGLQDKLKSFEAGADDHLTKPFEAAELAIRMTALLRRLEAAKSALENRPAAQGARMIALHSLRGGTGCSSLAVNLGVALQGLWKQPAALLDLTMTAGQVALMLNLTLRRTWADMARFEMGDIDADVIASLTSLHESGLAVIPAPTFPVEADGLRGETLDSAIHQIKNQYEYVVADLPHDFSEPSLAGLDAADLILVVASPDMASIRAVTAALDTYEKLGYTREKIRFVLNAPFPRSSLSKDKIEAALGMSAVVTIPYVEDVFVNAINLGSPLVYSKTELPVSGVLEDLAFHLSRDAHKKSKPQNPSEVWLRVYQRYQERGKRR